MEEMQFHDGSASIIQRTDTCQRPSCMAGASGNQQLRRPQNGRVQVPRPFPAHARPAAANGNEAMLSSIRLHHFALDVNANAFGLYGPESCMLRIAPRGMDGMEYGVGDGQL